jgi:hypothetical protein
MVSKKKWVRLIYGSGETIMPEEDKLRVQIYANLSLAFIAAAFTTLAGIVGGFALSAEKLTRG